MKLLPAPFGLDAINGSCISLLAPGAFDDSAIEEILLQYSCHAPAIPIIRSCLRFSGRYDCILQAGWFRDQRNYVIADLAAIGVKLVYHGDLIALRGDLFSSKLGTWFTK